MPVRKIPIAPHTIYHVYNRSISKYKVFNNHAEFLKLLNSIRFFINKNQPASEIHIGQKLIDIIAYCLMPTHIHFILREYREGAIKALMGSIQKSYTQYFNFKHKRRGPLWESRFKNVMVKKDEQLLHLTRYIHLNPVTDYIVDDPADWLYSSYREYLNSEVENYSICSFEDYLSIDSKEYSKFVTDRISYQRELSKIKHLVGELE